MLILDPLVLFGYFGHEKGKVILGLELMTFSFEVQHSTTKLLAVMLQL